MARPLGALRALSCAAGLLAATGESSFSTVVEPVFRRPSLDDRCPCQDPLGSGECYDPVCPTGYFRCCVDCTQSPCFGSVRMELSFRGVPECILCSPGDFCDGCDDFTKCPDNDSPDRAGPRVSPPGSTRFNDCESCPPEKEASFDNSVCMLKYSSVCSKEFVNRCINNCWAADTRRGKNMTECEKLKCMMYCARQWSEECADAVGRHCRYMVSGQDDVSNMLITQASSPPEATLTDCDVDCSGVPKATLAALVTLVLALAGALRA